MPIRLLDIGYLNFQNCAMKTITLKNEEGETMEVRRGGRSGIQVRHSDRTGEEWGDYYEHPEKHPELKSIAEKAGAAGIDIKNESSIEVLFHLQKLGYRLILKDEDLILGADEVKMINEAITQLE